MSFSTTGSVVGSSINASFNSNTLGSLITTGGNIGIGTTSPSYILDVNNIANFSGNLYQSGSLMQTSFKNRIINGAMMIDQRNTGGSKAITAGAAAVYTIDRWYVSCSGANVTTQRALLLNILYQLNPKFFTTLFLFILFTNYIIWQIEILIII